MKENLYKKASSFNSLVKEKYLPKAREALTKTKTVFENQKEKMPPNVKTNIDKIQTLAKNKYDLASPYLKKGSQKTYSFIKKRPFISGIVALTCLASIGNCTSTKAPQVAARTPIKSSASKINWNKRVREMPYSERSAWCSVKTKPIWLSGLSMWSKNEYEATRDYNNCMKNIATLMKEEAEQKEINKRKAAIRQKQWEKERKAQEAKKALERQKKKMAQQAEKKRVDDLFDEF